MNHLRPGLGVAQHVLDPVDDHEHDVIVNRPFEKSSRKQRKIRLGLVSGLTS